MTWKHTTYQQTGTINSVIFYLEFWLVAILRSNRQLMTSTYYDFISGCILTDKIENLELANTSFCSGIRDVNTVIHSQLYVQQYRHWQMSVEQGAHFNLGFFNGEDISVFLLPIFSSPQLNSYSMWFIICFLENGKQMYVNVFKLFSKLGTYS